MTGPRDGPDRAEEEADWTPPRKSLLRKAGLTVLLIALGVAPGLALMATDPLGTNEVPPEAAQPAEAHATSSTAAGPPAATQPPVEPTPSVRPTPGVQPMPDLEPSVPPMPAGVERRDPVHHVEPEAPEAPASTPMHPEGPAADKRHCLLVVCLG